MLQSKKYAITFGILLIALIAVNTPNIRCGDNDNNNNESSNSNNPNPLKRKGEPEENKEKIKKQKLSEEDVEQLKFLYIVQLMNQFINNKQPLPSQQWEMINAIKQLKDINIRHTKMRGAQPATLNTLAHLAAFAKTNVVLNYLLDNHANVKLKNLNGDTPLMNAIHSGNFEAIQMLLPRYSTEDLNLLNNYQISYLRRAMQSLVATTDFDKKEGYAEVIINLLQHGALPLALPNQVSDVDFFKRNIAETLGNDSKETILGLLALAELQEQIKNQYFNTESQKMRKFKKFTKEEDKEEDN